MRHRFVPAMALLVGAVTAWQVHVRSQAPPFDILIRNAHVVDGGGNPWFTADIGITGDSIAAVAPHLDGSAARVIDANGRVAAPGFIDVHSHSEARDDGQDPIGNPAAEMTSGRASRP